MVVTRAGSDRLTVSALADVRPPGLAAPGWFAARGEAPRQHVEYLNSGATVGGPLLFRKLFSFTAWEHQRIDRSVVADILVPSLSVREETPGPLGDVLQTFPAPNGPTVGNGTARYTGPFAWGSTLSAISSRFDTSLSANHHLFARVNRGVSHGDAIPWVSRQMPYAYRSTESTATWTGTTGLVFHAVALAQSRDADQRRPASDDTRGFAVGWILIRL